ncbi:MAG TPA: 16S rRNA (guanine(527)-N(7))-methyltransferase RsmG [Candidatus Eisenbacteria bacterium]|nr:16S rRNA (guanine(527)-N(7))-methyltransferase RsmG [Candidatus Eisenbacteria bacterium]
MEYLAELKAWNARGNLVSQADVPRLVSRHVAESLAAVPLIDRIHPTQVLDLGSGGGFPIVPIKLARPELQVALVEARHLKSLFLRRVRERLDLRGFWVWNMRAEVLAGLPVAAQGASLEAASASANEGVPTMRPIVDLVTVRAVASLSELTRWSESLIASGGHLLAFKGSRLDQELAEWKTDPRGWSLEDVVPLSPEIRIVLFRRS